MGGPIEKLVLSVFKATLYLAWLAVLQSIIMFWEALSDTKQSSLSLEYHHLLLLFALFSGRQVG